MKQFGILAILVAAINCAPNPAPVTQTMNHLVFLTRGGCVQSDTLRTNLDAALKDLDAPTDYQFIDLDSLSKDDVRTGYPTPTLLYEAVDLFGLTAPTPPFPEPT